MIAFEQTRGRPHLWAPTLTLEQFRMSKDSRLAAIQLASPLTGHAWVVSGDTLSVMGTPPVGGVEKASAMEKAFAAQVLHPCNPLVITLTVVSPLVGPLAPG